GPFKNPINKVAAKIFLPRMSLIVSRGAITHQYLLELGLNNVVAGADYAFLLESQDRDFEIAKKYIDREKLAGKKIVGISPSVVLNKKVTASGLDYVAINRDFIEDLLKQDFTV